MKQEGSKMMDGEDSDRLEVVDLRTEERHHTLNDCRHCGVIHTNA